MFSYLKQQFDPIIEKVKSSPTTGYLKDRVVMANKKVRSFIDKRVQGRSSEVKMDDMETPTPTPSRPMDS